MRITTEISADFARRRWRPNCYICGRFIGAGGVYDVYYDGYNGGWEEGYSTCKQHTDQGDMGKEQGDG